MAPTPIETDAPPARTRRQAREAEQRAVRSRGAVRARVRRHPRVLEAASVPAVPPRRRSEAVRTLVTVLVVPGLFATAALPAYAASVSDDGQVVSAVAGRQSLFVPATAALSVVDRGGVSATSDEEMAARKADPARAARVAEYEASGARELGDDYPWPYEAADIEGGGLSPLSYYYRECVDFVAWRINRDAGVTHGPWKYTWFQLTPAGGDASQWASAWRAHGWPTGDEPVPGAVAWFNGNHVAYVKAVTEDGQVVIEEYNHGSSHKYGVRTIPVSAVALFLYAPPR